ncbi:hypothetical protein RND71_003206 [Anisodus tanguticus]|uniref:Uncharacterized protein n=1 Tax=Anisodus tanguticus TaxID=243964 RepID=A0AAE1SW81_9SOLA|nr:hypothetical protein RND71_003206 [Anisodus tanguticus]
MKGYYFFKISKLTSDFEQNPPKISDLNREKEIIQQENQLLKEPKNGIISKHIDHKKIEQGSIMIQFESSKLVEVPSLKKALNTFKLDDHSKDKDSETWTLVSHNRHNHKKRFLVSNPKSERKHKSSANMEKHKVQRQELVK